MLSRPADLDSASRPTDRAAHFNWCFSTLGCPALTLEQALGLASAWDFGGIELRALEGSIDLVEVLTRRFGEPAKLAAMMADRKVKICALDASMHLRGSSAKDRAELLALAPWADALGIERVRVFDGGRNEKLLSAEARDDMLNTFDWWQRERKRAGLRCDLMIETHWILTNPENCVALARAASERVGILWDSFHTWAHAEMSLPETWQRLAPHVCHIHLRDGVRDATKPEGARYLLPGEGAYPLSELLQLVGASDYRGWLSFEWERHWHPELPALEDALAAGKRIGLW
jgi:sugar phosphate isomerase/epimerase